MFGYFKKRMKGKEVSKDTATNSDKFKSKQRLSFHQDWASQPKILLDVLKSDFEKLSNVNSNEVRLSGIYAYPKQGELEVAFFISNGLQSSITVGEVPLVIYDDKNQVVVAQVFDLSTMGTIPARCSRPWKVNFKAHTIRQSFITGTWRIGFGVQKPQNMSTEV